MKKDLLTLSVILVSAVHLNAEAAQAKLSDYKNVLSDGQVIELSAPTPEYKKIIPELNKRKALTAKAIGRYEFVCSMEQAQLNQDYWEITSKKEDVFQFDDAESSLILIFKKDSPIAHQIADGCKGKKKVAFKVKYEMYFEALASPLLLEVSK